MIRSRPNFDFPVMVQGSNDYDLASTYSAPLEYEQGKGLTVNHGISSDNLVSKAVSDGRAKFAVSVANTQKIEGKWLVHDAADTKSPQTISETYFSDDSSFRPVVVAVTEIREKSSGMGLNESYWKNRDIVIPKWGIMADAQFSHLRPPDLISILVPLEAPDQKDGTVRTTFDETRDGGVFVVYLSPKLYKACMDDKPYSRFVWTAALADGLSKLRSRYEKGDDSWTNVRNLVTLNEVLGKQRPPLPNWTEPAFEPLEVASSLCPYIFDEKNDDV